MICNCRGTENTRKNYSPKGELGTTSELKWEEEMTRRNEKEKGKLEHRELYKRRD